MLIQFILLSLTSILFSWMIPLTVLGLLTPQRDTRYVCSIMLWSYFGIASMLLMLHRALYLTYTSEHLVVTVLLLGISVYFVSFNWNKLQQL